MNEKIKKKELVSLHSVKVASESYGVRIGVMPKMTKCEKPQPRAYGQGCCPLADPWHQECGL